MSRPFKKDQVLREKLKRKISSCNGINARAKSALKNKGIKTIGQLVHFLEEDVLKFKGIGEKTIMVIRKVLCKMQLHFGMKEEIERMKKRSKKKKNPIQDSLL